MKKTPLKLIFTVLTLIICLGVACIWFYRDSKHLSFASVPRVETEQSEEYAVYSLIRQPFLKDGVKFLVIQDHMLFYANPDYLKSTTAEQRIQEMKGYYPSVDESTLRDFESKHINSSAMRPISWPVLLSLSKKKRDRLHSFWEAYYLCSSVSVMFITRIKLRVVGTLLGTMIFLWFVFLQLSTPCWTR